MTASAPFDHGPRDRFFRAMVLMGSSLALGCGGLSVDDSPSGEDADDLDGRAGTGGTGAAGTGGAPSTAAGSGGTATAHPGSGGVSGSGGATATRLCPDEQRTCTSFACQDDVWAQQGRCYCDYSLPASAADCAAGTTLTCRPTLTDPQTGAVLAQATRVDCRCIPVVQRCADVCLAAYPGSFHGYHCVEASPEPNDTLCGCAYIYPR